MNGILKKMIQSDHKEQNKGRRRQKNFNRKKNKENKRNRKNEDRSLITPRAKKSKPKINKN